MLTLKSLNADKPLSVFLAIHFAEKALPIWEAEYPKDMRPRRAIEAAKAWLSKPGKEAAHAAYAATYTNAAALGKYARPFIHHHLIQILPLILWHKMNSKKSFGESEKLFELLHEDCREDFLFNLDWLR